MPDQAVAAARAAGGRFAVRRQRENAARPPCKLKHAPTPGVTRTDEPFAYLPNQGIVLAKKRFDKTFPWATRWPGRLVRCAPGRTSSAPAHPEQYAERKSREKRLK